MMESMTGFGEGSGEGRKLLFTVSARSVNHRYLDVSIRMPEFLRRHERGLADLVRSLIERGRVELRVESSPIGEEVRRVELRQSVLRAYQDAILSARAEGLLAGELSAGEFLRLPEVVEVFTEEAESDDADLAALHHAASTALESLRTARRSEGERLEQSLHQILSELSTELAALDAVRVQLREELATRAHERLELLIADVELESDRLAMEVALLAERSDIQEELDRLASHLAGFKELRGSPDPVGKKMDFLCQEIRRELNTVGSKCRESKAMAHVLEGKVVCERLREQVQNIQ